MKKNKSLIVLRVVSDYMARKGVYYRDAEITELIKTFTGYRNALQRAVYDLYNYRVDELTFVGRVADLITDQLSRAYREGLRAAGHDPKHMTGAMDLELNSVINSEEFFILEFASEILENRDKDPRPPSTIFMPKIELRAFRYNDVVNMAAARATKDGDLMEWTLGATEEHCPECAGLHGKVATKFQWSNSQYKPQNPPNEMLTCGGWRCDCKLMPTEKKATIPADGIITI